jgi:hypothetical protein
VPQEGPRPGELWAVNEAFGYAVFLGSDVWNVLTRAREEYSLDQVAGLTPVYLAATQPSGPHWADQFDALAEANGLMITWAEEIAAYQAEGFARIAAAAG